MRSFASDNNSGVHPRVMDAIIKANDNHAVGYGDDPWTEAATSKIQEVFGKDASPFFVFNGTGANSVALQAVTRPFNSILCAETAHINADTGIDPSPSEELRGLPPFATQGRLYLPSIGIRYDLYDRGSESDRRSLTFVRYVSAYGRSTLGERLRLPELHDAPSDRRRRRGYLELRRHEKRYDDGRGRGIVPPGDHGEPAILPEAIRPASLEATLSLRPVHPLSGK